MEPMWDTQHIPIPVVIAEGVYRFAFADEAGVRFELAENVFLLPAL
jgi:hypothetical protein